MKGKKYTVEQIISKLRKAEVALSTGQSPAKAVHKLGVVEQTHYH